MAADTAPVAAPPEDGALVNGDSAQTPAKSKPLELQKQDSPTSIFSSLAPFGDIFTKTIDPNFLMTPAKQVGLVATQAITTMSFGEADSKAARKKLDDKQAEEDAATRLQAAHRGKSGRAKHALAKEARRYLAEADVKSGGALRYIGLALLVVGVAALVASQMQLEGLMEGLMEPSSAPEAVEKKRRMFNLFYRP